MSDRFMDRIVRYETQAQEAARRARRLREGLCETCGRPASVVLTDTGADLTCGCGWVKSVRKQCQAYTAAKRWVAMRGVR